MNKRIKTKWLKALRSGDYKQGKNVLHSAGKRGNHKFCCLGVLCDLYLNEKKKDWTEISDDRYTKLFSSSTKREDYIVLPNNVKRWAGLKENNPSVNDGINTLAGYNDNGYTFKQIADIIEKEL